MLGHRLLSSLDGAVSGFGKKTRVSRGGWRIRWRKSCCWWCAAPSQTATITKASQNGARPIWRFCGAFCPIITAFPASAGFTRYYVSSAVLCATRAVDRDGGAFEAIRRGEPFKQEWNGGDLVGLGGDRLLAENETAGGGERRDEVERRRAGGAVVASTRGLAVDGDVVRKVGPSFAPGDADPADLDTTTDFDKGHGRIEQRTVTVARQVDWLDGDRRFPGEVRLPNVATVVKVASRAELKDRCRFETRYYVSSAVLCATRAVQAVRAHWAIENSLHWVLDVTFGDDQSRLRPIFSL
jgi:hypothetical protein